MPTPQRAFCPVVGCKSEFTPGVPGSKRFFKFPVAQQRVSNRHLRLWIQFTRRNNFAPVNQRMCVDHFEGHNFKFDKRGTLMLKSDSVPTIFYDKDGKQVIITPRQNKRRYSQTDVDKYFNNELENQVNDWRREKIVEIKLLCRFCFTNDKKQKYYSIQKIQECNINPKDLIKLVGVDSEHYEEFFSDVVCEDCFKKTVQFQRYRVRCHKAQEKAIGKLQELNLRIDEATGVWIDDEALEKEVPPELIEPVYLKQEVVEDDGNNEDTPLSPMNNLFDSEDESMPESQSPDLNESKEGKSEIFFKQEPVDSPQKEVKEESTGQEEDAIFIDPPGETEESKKKRKKRNPDRKEGSIRKHECFFCHRILANFKEFRVHKCVKKITCTVNGCGRVFTQRQTYNNHIDAQHKKDRIRDYYCPACQTHRKLTILNFSDHCRQCAKEKKKKYVDKPILCAVRGCTEKSDNLELYIAHMMIHDSPSLVMRNPRGKELGEDDSFICDFCGRKFKKIQYLRKHREDAHLVGFDGNLFTCDKCGVTRTNRRQMQKHFVDRHIIWHLPCKVCGKVFKSHDLRYKHMLHHDASKRKNICQICTNKIGFITKAELYRHMIKIHSWTPPQKPHLCRLCNRTYLTVATLNLHQWKVHGIPIPQKEK